MPAKKDDGFTAEEKEAMRERAKELKKGKKSDGESDIREKIEKYPEPDRGIAERLHALIRATAPDLVPRTWYGMPAYAKDGKVVVFFRGAAMFKERYMTLGFNETAQLDEGTMWPIAYALTKLTDEDEQRIAELVRRAVG